MEQLTLETLFGLHERTAVITGGYGHLGTAMTMGLLAAGADVFVAARDKERFDLAFAGLDHKRLHFLSMDIESKVSITEALSKATILHEGIHILINNAFYGQAGLPDQMSDDQWAFTLDGTLTSVYRVIRESLPMLVDNRSSIINISSMYGMVAPDFRMYEGFEQFTNSPVYGAAKAGVIQLSKYFAVYLGQRGIRVNTLTPGPFPSQHVQAHPDFIQKLTEKNPLQRIGQPNDLAGAAVFLSSKASQYVTGQNLVVDGGWTAW